MIDAGIIDPTKVERIALEQAISLSGMFLTTEASITKIVKKDQNNSNLLPDLSALSKMPGFPAMPSY
jgi:chaperonin GroEL